MKSEDVGAVPVVESQSHEPKLVGIVTDRDIVVKSARGGACGREAHRSATR